jgi:hypothetical protein
MTKFITILSLIIGLSATSFTQRIKPKPQPVGREFGLPCFFAGVEPQLEDAGLFVDGERISVAYQSEETIDPLQGWAQADVIAIQTSGFQPVLGIVGASDGSRRYVTVDRLLGLSVTEYLGGTANAYYQNVEYWGDTATVRIKIKGGRVTYTWMQTGVSYTSPFPVVSATPLHAYFGGGGKNFFLSNLIVGVKTCN